MGLNLLFTIRTADRAPKRNYLGVTVASLIHQGMRPEDIHVVPTDPKREWMQDNLGENAVQVHWPDLRRRPNENGLAQIDLLDAHPEADWIVMTEDDLEWCHDPIGSITEWLTAHAEPYRLFYRFFAFGKLEPYLHGVQQAPLREQKGSQVVAMRRQHAKKFAAWARAHPLHWRPANAPFQDRPHDGFDKLLGYWALQEQPKVTSGLVSSPFFVRHLGVESAIHSHGLRRDHLFGGVNWSYRRPA